MNRIIVDRLKTLDPVIADICRISGTPGASIGVLHEGEVVYIHNYGFRDVKAQIAPDENTIYHIASLSKSFTAAAIGILVQEGKMSWDTPVHKLLQDFKQINSTVQQEATIVDFLSHRTGLALKNMLWLSEYASVDLQRKETLKMLSYLEHVYDFRTRWLYGNWGYAVADLIIERLSGQSWGSFLTERILDPLGLNRTKVKHSPDTQNVAKAYMTRSDGTPYQLPPPKVEDGLIMQGAVGVQSCVADLLRYSKNVMDAARDQERHYSNSTKGSPLKELSAILGRHIDLSPTPSDYERSYGLGWIRTELPGPLGTVGLNPLYVESMPIVGKGLSEPLMIYHHQGSLIDCLCSIQLVPSQRAAVVVLTNSMSLNDAADWLGQLVLEALLDVPQRNDYVKLARDSAKVSRALWPMMAEQLERMRIPDTPVRPLDDYVGCYYNIAKDYNIKVFEEDGCLRMRRQNKRYQSYHLKHYQFNTFSWLLTRDETVDRGLFPNTNAHYYLLRFVEDQDGKINEVVWINDPNAPEGHVFKKCTG